MSSSGTGSIVHLLSLSPSLTLSSSVCTGRSRALFSPRLKLQSPPSPKRGRPLVFSGGPPVAPAYSATISSHTFQQRLDATITTEQLILCYCLYTILYLFYYQARLTFGLIRENVAGILFLIQFNTKTDPSLYGFYRKVIINFQPYCYLMV